MNRKIISLFTLNVQKMKFKIVTINVFIIICIIQSALGQEISGKLLGLGHVAEISFLRNSGDRLLSKDIHGWWILWDTTNRQQIMRGNNKINYVDFKKNTLAVSDGNRVQLISAIDGTTLTEIPVSSSDKVGLSKDGSYLWVAKASSLTAWSLSGYQLINCDGNYLNSEVFADIDSIKVANGPWGSSVIESIYLYSGSIVISPNFSGDFHSWFLDGSHFLTTVSSAVYVYSTYAEQEALVYLETTESLGGSGLYFWTHGKHDFPSYPLKIYKIGNGSIPIKIFTTGTLYKIFPSFNMIGILPYAYNEFEIVHLEVDSVTKTTHTSQGGYLTAFDADEIGSWSVGNRSGVIYDNLSSNLPFESKALGYGRVRSITGSPGNMGAVATANGQILIFRISNDEKYLNMKIMYDSSHLELSDDGSILAAQANADVAQYSPDISLTIFSLPSANIIRKWEYSFSTSTDRLFDFDLSLNGFAASRLEGLFNYQWYKKSLINVITDGSLILSLDGDANGAPQLSPEGTYSAISKGYDLTMIYENEKLLAAISGRSAGFIDNQRLLINFYSINKWGYWEFISSCIYDKNGTWISDLSLPEITRFTTISDTKIFSHNQNAVFDLESGDCIWKEEVTAADSIGSDYVIYEKNGELWWHKWDISDLNFTISGSVKLSSGEGLRGVTLAFSNQGGTATTGSDGDYAHEVGYGWSGTTTPSKAGYTFSPSSQRYENVTSDQTGQDYTATLLTYTISGKVNTGEASVKMKISGQRDGVITSGLYRNPQTDKMSVVSSSGRMRTQAVLSGVVMNGLPGNPTTDSDGNYSATVEYGWSGTVTPTKAGYTFSPSSRTYSNVTSDQLSQDYAATAITPTISGVVKASDGTVIEGVTITFTNEGGTATTDSSGSYSHSVSYGWSGAATPSKTHYTFDPSSRSYSNLTSDQISQDYTASLVQYMLTISAGTGGTTDPSPRTHTYDAGTEVSVKAIPDSGYQFSGWSGDVPEGQENDNPLMITMDTNKTLTANFTLNTYTLTAQVDPSGGGSVVRNPDREEYSHGESVELTANANSGYTFNGWTGDVPSGHENDNPVTITMDSNKSVTANFRAITTAEEPAGKKGGCFIATAAYGSSLHSYVRVLRNFRDKYLIPTKFGRVMVNLYYRYSPIVASLIAKYKPLKVAAQIILLPMIAFSYSMLHFGLIITTVMLVFIFVFPICLISFWRKKIIKRSKQVL